MNTTVLRPLRMHAILQMMAHRARQHAAFDIASLADEIVGRIAMADALDVLVDDRAFVERAGDVMRGGADQFDAAFMRLVIGPRALEARQERMMDIDAAPRQPRRHLVRQDLHVARQHHEIGLGLADQIPDRVFPARAWSPWSPAGSETGSRRNRDCRSSRADDWRRWRSGSSPVRRCASDRGYRQGSDRISRPAASPGGGVARSRICQSMPKRSAIAVKPVCREARLTARSAALNTTRMKKWPVSTSLNCWASRMFWPLWARKVDTAETMPGRSGQDKVRTN